jgi:hypothetical protein
MLFNTLPEKEVDTSMGLNMLEDPAPGYFGWMGIFVARVNQPHDLRAWGVKRVCDNLNPSCTLINNFVVQLF